MTLGSLWTETGYAGYTLTDMRCERQSETVTVHCPCIDGRVPALAEIANTLLPNDRNVVVDLAAIGLLRSAELSYLVELQRYTTASGRTLRLAHVGPDIRKVLAITRLDRLFTISDETTM